MRFKRTMAELEMDIAEAQRDRLAEVAHRYVFGGDADRAYTVTVGLVRAARELAAAEMAVRVETLRRRRAA